MIHDNYVLKFIAYIVFANYVFFLTKWKFFNMKILNEIYNFMMCVFILIFK